MKSAAHFRISGELLRDRCLSDVDNERPFNPLPVQWYVMQSPSNGSARLRFSLAACALVVATSTTEASRQSASGFHADTSVAGQPDEAGHLKKIQAYCIRSWQNAGILQQEWDDCTQDVYLRLFSRLSRHQLSTAVNEPESSARRELNRAIWATSQKRRRARSHTSLAEDVSEPIIPGQCSDQSESIQLIRQAIQSETSKLTPIQRRIIDQWADGEPIRAIARQLSMSSARVSDEKYKAIQKLRHHLTAGIHVH